MNYRAGWLMKNGILALTHFTPVVTPKDFMDITADTQKALQEANRAFHILIDNRIIAETTVASLETMLQAMPIIRHPHLRWIVIVLPEAIKAQAASMDIQRNGTIRLKYVDSLDAAFAHVAQVDRRIDGSPISFSFFEPDGAVSSKNGH